MIRNSTVFYRGQEPKSGTPSDTLRVLRVYHIGNSVTDTIRYASLKEAAKGKNKTYIFGRHMIPGAPLQWIWEHPGDGIKEEPFGYYPQALPGHEWDVITLQPFDRHLDGKEGDVRMARNYLDIAFKKSPRARVYVYSRWPRRDKENAPIDFAAKWARRYTGGWDGTEETREYFERLLAELKKAYPDKAGQLFLVPVGDVLLELDKQMRAGNVPGYSSVVSLYEDQIHFNDVGAYLVSCTFYATLFRDDPHGLSPLPYKVTDSALVRRIQDIVWQVVRTHTLAGVR